MSVTPLKKGDTVVMHTSIEAMEHDGRLWTCRTDEFKHHPRHDYTSVMLDGYSGSFQTAYLQKVNLPSDAPPDAKDDMPVTGTTLIDWIRTNGLEDALVHIHVSDDHVVQPIQPDQLVIDECGDILIANPDRKGDV